MAQDIDTHGFPTHLGGKVWIDTEDFCTAWLVALAMHGAEVDGAKVRAAIARSRPPRNQPAG